MYSVRLFRFGTRVFFLIFFIWCLRWVLCLNAQWEFSFSSFDVGFIWVWVWIVEWGGSLLGWGHFSHENRPHFLSSNFRIVQFIPFWVAQIIIQLDFHLTLLLFLDFFVLFLLWFHLICRHFELQWHNVPDWFHWLHILSTGFQTYRWFCFDSCFLFGFWLFFFLSVSHLHQHNDACVIYR